MFKNILSLFSVLFFAMAAHAELTVNCATSDKDITSQLYFNGSDVKVSVLKNKAQVYSKEGHATYSDKWNTVTADATGQTVTGLYGVKIYFALARNNASIRPYGLTQEDLYPGSEGIMVTGMTCDKDYQTILNEVQN